MQCPHCGEQMIWDSDADFEDLGREGRGIVTMYHCPRCEADIELSVPIDKECTTYTED